MAFNQLVVKSYAGGVTQAFVAPWTAYKGSLVALNGIAPGTVVSTAGLVIACGAPQFNIEWESLVANVQSVLTTATLTAIGLWQGSQDSTNWVTLLGPNGAAATTSGSAGASTSTYCHAFAGGNPAFPYIRWACTTGVTTGAAGDNVTVSLNWRKRATINS
jgi:hypothetical protein